uniref:Large ribosomal subunit protein uL22c n=2 Tax=Cephalotaxus harringtonia TaxID=58029 RepID=G4LAR2_CEPHW|nr:ribosomal protein L22 [Cephalotaxus harringtonia var. wilsoniana]YP_010138202.1 ribosomal protein L22 [Cephalotaxus harringtonia]UPV70558.1 ribosomal protein L22 [Cephalotaxus harringtonia var. nana]QPO89978.1 ribosomal protein L22 [Cephalotaxus harringtonia]UPV70066.1 ribosomal protein L22 [Cephalotaxus harringtonia]UPV70640.1 ribosomal protein L22 [Cephalotaxus harringtonia var. nana]UPV71870.1 ribosomal protein L22 [Cephalotaxus harringtonia var. wilsoniana]
MLKITKIRALGKDIHISSNKARRVINQIRGRSHAEALNILSRMPYGACYPIFKILRSAVANAETMGVKSIHLFVSRAEVNEGALFKRFQPRARGHGYPIHKPTCHVTIVLEQNVNFKEILLNALKDVKKFQDLPKELEGYELIARWKIKYGQMKIEID